MGWAGLASYNAWQAARDHVDCGASPAAEDAGEKNQRYNNYFCSNVRNSFSCTTAALHKGNNSSMVTSAI